MNVAEIATARLIGAVFVERGLLSESQIRVALEIQRETGQQLGQILVERFGVTRKELASVVAEQWADIGRSSPPGLDAAANESWRRLGEIFVERGFVTPEQLEQALERQRETGERVGEALVAQGSISKFELAGALAEQMSALEEAAAAGESAPTDATVVSLASRLEEPPRADEQVPDSTSMLASRLEAQAPAERQLLASARALAARLEEARAPTDEQALAPDSLPEPTPLSVVRQEPERRPASGWVAFASTTTGYRLVHVDGGVPAIGETIEVPDVGEVVVLRIGRSPLPGDARACVYLEQLVRADAALVG